MVFRTKIEEKMVPRVYEQDSNYYMSRGAANRNDMNLIRLEHIPALLRNKAFMEMLQSTQAFSKEGAACFWTGDRGTNLNGYYLINQRTGPEESKFIFLSNRMDDKVYNIPDDKRAQFTKGELPLIVEIFKLPNEFHVSVSANRPTRFCASLIVLEQKRSRDIVRSRDGKVLFLSEDLFRSKRST